jgi:hypothetical protein
VKAGVACGKSGLQGAEPCSRVRKVRSKIDHSLLGERHERSSGRTIVRFFVVRFRSAYRLGPQSQAVKPSGLTTMCSLFLMKIDSRSSKKP